jgi:hypothetical protein
LENSHRCGTGDRVGRARVLVAGLVVTLAVVALAVVVHTPKTVKMAPN